MNYEQRLRDLREDKDLNQTQVADIIGTSQSYYAQYENGKRELPFNRAIKLAKFYNVSIDYLAGIISTPRTLDGSPYCVKKTININDASSGNKFTGKEKSHCLTSIHTQADTTHAPVTITNGTERELSKQEIELLNIFEHLSVIAQAKLLISAEELKEKNNVNQK